MKKNLIILLVLVSGIVFSACENDLTELNVDTKNPAEVQSGSLFANSIVTLTRFMASTNVNVNNWRLWSQYWTQTTYTDESNYELVRRNVNGRMISTLSSGVLMDLAESKKLLNNYPNSTPDQIKVQEGMIEVMEVFTTSILVDTFGDIPYSDRLKGRENLAPKYDDAFEVYKNLFSKLDVAIGKLDGDMGVFSRSDLIYDGNTEKWKMFANSVKLRMAVRIADFDKSLAKMQAEEAVSGGVFNSSSDNFKLDFQGFPPNTNPLWVDLVQSGRSDFVVAETIVNYLKELDDPRQSKYFDSTHLAGGEHVGLYPGKSGGYGSFTHVSKSFLDPVFFHEVMSYSEVEFLLAHAAADGLIGGGDDAAEMHYQEGIKASMTSWGVLDSEIDTYLAMSSVAWDTADGNWRAKIGKQKWIAMYNRPFEGWTTYRIYDFNDLIQKAADAGTYPPSRFTYPPSEYSLNKTNVTAAAAAIGGDELTTKLFWDVY